MSKPPSIYIATFSTFRELDDAATHWYVSLRGPTLRGRMDAGAYRTRKHAQQAAIHVFNDHLNMLAEQREYDGSDPLTNNALLIEHLGDRLAEWKPKEIQDEPDRTRTDQPHPEGTQPQLHG